MIFSNYAKKTSKIITKNREAKLATYSEDLSQYIKKIILIMIEKKLSWQ